MMDFGIKEVMMIAGFLVMVGGNILLMGMAWGSLRGRLNHIGEAVGLT